MHQHSFLLPVLFEGTLQAPRVHTALETSGAFSTRIGVTSLEKAVTKFTLRLVSEMFTFLGIVDVAFH